jgi:predicted kinase
VTKQEVINKLKNQCHKVIILRGVSGSGKTEFINDLETLVKSPLDDDLQVCSADHFFVRERDGKYIFQKHLTNQAHAACRDNFEYFAAKKNSSRPIYLVVDNQNPSMKDMEFYIKTAQEYRWDLCIVTFKVAPEVAFSRTIHKTTLKDVLDMEKEMHSCKIPSKIEHFVVDTE